MKVSCKLNLEFENKKKAKDILRSISVDDFDFVNSKVDGKNLNATLKSDSISSMIHTLDDYLACISVAEKVVDKS